MTIRKKMILWGLGFLLILLVALSLLVPTLIDSSSLKHKIQTAVRQKNIGEIDYQKSYLSLLPLPHLTIEKIVFSAPKRTSASVENVMVYPELLPLFHGELRLSKVIFDTPVVKVAISDEPSTKPESKKEPEIFNLADSLLQAIDPLAAFTSGLTVSIEQGSFDLTGEDQQKIEIRELELDADIDIIGPRSFDANLNIVSSNFAIMQAGKQVKIDCDRFKTELRVDDDTVALSLVDIRLAQPALKLSGHFIASPGTSGFSLDLKGKDLDVKAIRAAALGLGGDNETVKDTFSYLKSGRIPLITLQSKSKSLSTLGDFDNMVIQGRLQNSDISIDDIGMQLAEVTGDALISKGLLEASGASARLGQTTGHDGDLKLGLAEGNDTFHLDIILNAQLHEVPTVLKKIVDDGPFIHELSLIKSITGASTARLMLGESLDELNTSIEFLEMDFTADYHRVPFPIKISHGKLSYQENMLNGTGLSGAVGSSVFLKTSCNVQWEKELRIDIPDGRLNLDLGELYPWISTFDDLKEALADVKEVTGSMALSTFKLTGPDDIDGLSEQWQMSATGEVDTVTINTTLLPETLHLFAGKIQMTTNKLLFKNLSAQLMDAQFDLTGTLQGDISQPDRVDLSLSGDMGRRTIQYLTQSGYLPAAYAVRAPVKFANTDVTWQSADDFLFKGNVFFSQDVQVQTDFNYQAGHLKVNHLDIKDADSAFTSAFCFKKDMIHLIFNGYLHNKTLERIFDAEKFSDGWLKGDFQVTFVKDKLSESTLKGQLQAGDLMVPLAESTPLTIDKLSLTANNHTIDVNQMILAHQKNRVELKGRVDLNKDEFVFDLDASAGALRWDVSEKNSEKTPEKGPKSSNDPSDVPSKDSPKDSAKDKSEKNLWKYPISGKINLSAESFTWDQFYWTPFQAEFFLEQDKMKMEVTKASLCGVDTLGTIIMAGNSLDIDIRCTAKERDISTAYGCLSNNEIEMTGVFDFTGQIKAQGQAEDLLGSAKGQFEYEARNGQITKDKYLSKILEVVTFTEIVKGRLPDLYSEGFGYKTINVEGEFSDNMMVFTKFYMDGKTLDLLGKGTLDLKQLVFDVELLAAPFKTVDSAIKSIPGVNYLMAGNLISIPVSVRGPVADPKVSILSATDISSSFMDFAERAIKSPLKFIESFPFYKKPEPK